MNIMSTLEGKLVANNMKVGIVVARFNEFITNKLCLLYTSDAADD